MCPKAPDSAGLHRSSADQEVPKLGEAGGLEHRMPARGQVMALLRGDLEGSLVPPCQSSAISLASPLCGNQLPSIPSPWRPPTPLGPTDLTTPSLQGDSGRFGFPPLGSPLFACTKTLALNMISVITARDGRLEGT